MAHFCNCGADEYICQECGKVRCSKEQKGEWITVKRTGREGNVCADCTAKEVADISAYLIATHKRGGGVGGHIFKRLRELTNE